MRKLAYLLLPLALIVAFAGCKKQQPATSSSEQALWKMTLTTDPAPAVEDQDTAFKLVLADNLGQPVAGAEVKADLKMATMDMGKNEIPLVDRGSGNYEGKGKFTMAGPWHVIVTAKQGGKTGQQTFEIVAHRK